MLNRKLHNHGYDEIITKLGLDDVEQYAVRSTWLDYLNLMNKSAKKGWRIHNFAQIMVILLSLSIPVIEKTKLNWNIFNWDLSLISILGLIVAAVTALNRQLASEEKWRHYRFATEVMRNEGDDFIARAGNYKQFATHKDAFQLFIQNVTTFKRKEISMYLEAQKNQKNNEAAK